MKNPLLALESSCDPSHNSRLVIGKVFSYIRLRKGTERGLIAEVQ
jgi:hypothetical protein